MCVMRLMLVLWVACALGALCPNPCSALDTFLPDPGIEPKANQALRLEHEEGERFDLFPVEEGAFDVLETHPSKGNPIMLVNTFNKVNFPANFYFKHSYKFRSPVKG